MAGEVAAVRTWESGAAFYPAVEGDTDSYSAQGTTVRNGSLSGLLVLNGNEFESYNPGWRRCLLRETLNNSNQDVMRAERYGDHYFYTWSYRINSGTYVPSGHLIWEIHGPNEDWPANTSLVAPHCIQWRNNEWQYRVHTGRRSNTGSGTQIFGGEIFNYSLGLTSKNEGLWRDWIVEILYDDPGIINVWTRLEGTSAFTQVMQRTNPGICYVNDKTEDHRYYRTEGIYQALPSPTSTECRVWVDNGGRSLSYNEALAVFGESPSGGTPVYFSDTWDNGIIASDWTSYNTTWTISETGGVLSIAGSGSTGSAGVTSRLTNYDLSNSEISVRVPNPGNISTVSQLIVYLAFNDDASNSIALRLVNNQIIAYKKVAGVETNLLTSAYNAVGHQFLRLRAVGTTLYFDTSADGSSWVNYHSVTVPITITSGYIDIGATATSPSATVGTITFDNFVYQAQSGGTINPDPNPSSFPILNGSSDGYAHAVDTTYAAASGGTPASLLWKDTDTTMYVGRTYDGVSDYTVDTVVLQFDTSGIPDTATVQSAFLDILPPSCGSTDTRNLVGEYYTGSLATTAHTANISGTACFADKSISTIVANQLLSLPLTNISNISKTGVTKLRLQVSGGSPTGSNWVGISGFESNRAVMRVTYITSSGTYTYVYATAGTNGTNAGTKQTNSPRTTANGTRDYTRI